MKPGKYFGFAKVIYAAIDMEMTGTQMSGKYAGVSMVEKPVNTGLRQGGQ